MIRMFFLLCFMCMKSVLQQEHALTFAFNLPSLGDAAQPDGELDDVACVVLCLWEGGVSGT